MGAATGKLIIQQFEGKSKESPATDAEKHDIQQKSASMLVNGDANAVGDIPPIDDVVEEPTSGTTSPTSNVENVNGTSKHSPTEDSGVKKRNNKPMAWMKRHLSLHIESPKKLHMKRQGKRASIGTTPEKSAVPPSVPEGNEAASKEMSPTTSNEEAIAAAVVQEAITSAVAEKEEMERSPVEEMVTPTSATSTDQPMTSAESSAPQSPETVVCVEQMAHMTMSDVAAPSCEMSKEMTSDREQPMESPMEPETKSAGSSESLEMAKESAGMMMADKSDMDEELASPVEQPHMCESKGPEETEEKQQESEAEEEMPKVVDTNNTNVAEEPAASDSDPEMAHHHQMPVSEPMTHESGSDKSENESVNDHTEIQINGE